MKECSASPPWKSGISTFDLSRYTGASLTMIDRHYGHSPVTDTSTHTKLLDALTTSELERWTLMDAAWKPQTPPEATTLHPGAICNHETGSAIAWPR